jgi:thioredoxin-like negative regulator of GroEL
MSKKEKSEREKTSTHHIVCQSRDGSSHSHNLIELRTTTHQALHTLFQNQLLAEQLITTVNISSKALRPEVKERLLETLTAHDADDLEFWYKPECYK